MPRQGRAGEQSRGGNAGRRADVLDVLRRASRPLPIAQIAEQLGVHPNTVRFHLDSLTAKGRVERVSAAHRTPGRPPQLFRAVRGMDPAGPRQYRMLAEVLVESFGDDPQAHRQAIRAGRAWGRRRGAAEPLGPGDREGLEPVGRLFRLLDALGFAPEPMRHEPGRPELMPAERPGEQLPRGGPQRAGSTPAAQPEIRLRNCPFLDLAQTRPQIVCPIHLGVMQGAMDAWGGPVTVDRLDAFVEPDLCVVHLTTAIEPSGQRAARESKSP